MSPKDGTTVLKNTTSPRERNARVQSVQAPPGRVSSGFVIKQLVADGLLSAADAERFKTSGGRERSGHPLVVLAEKGGVDVEETRRAYPRVGEVPFDSDYKFMATFHEMENGRPVVRCFVKGAPDVLLARSSHIREADGSAVPADSGRDRVLADRQDRLSGCERRRIR